MNTAQLIQFQKPAKPKQEAIVDTRKEDGFTPLPNFICDEGYLAVLSGDAAKCLIFLNRHVDGFHLDRKSMGESLVMKITGIKDKRTIRKYMAELAKYQLISIHKENGKRNIYSITYEHRTPVTPDATGSIKPVTHHATGESQEPVPSHVATSYAPVTRDATAPVTPHVPTTSDMPCHSVKEIYLKENIKENNNYKAPAEFVPQDRGALNFIDYHSDDPKLYTLKDLSGIYPIKKDFMAQAAVSFPKLSQDIVLEQLKELAQWSVGQPERISQKWMTTWLNWLRNYQPSKPKADPKQPKAEQPKRHRYGQGVIPRGES